jgi:hypothetical protein
MRETVEVGTPARAASPVRDKPALVRAWRSRLDAEVTSVAYMQRRSGNAVVQAGSRRHIGVHQLFSLCCVSAVGLGGPFDEADQDVAGVTVEVAAGPVITHWTGSPDAVANIATPWHSTRGCGSWRSALRLAGCCLSALSDADQETAAAAYERVRRCLDHPPIYRWKDGVVSDAGGGPTP